MAHGSISHIALTVSGLARSTAFYDKVFELICFKRVEVPESTQQAMKTRLKALGRTGLFNIDPSVEGEICAPAAARSKNAPGFNHSGLYCGGPIGR